VRQEGKNSWNGESYDSQLRNCDICSEIGINEHNGINHKNLDKGTVLLLIESYRFNVDSLDNKDEVQQHHTNWEEVGWSSPSNQNNNHKVFLVKMFYFESKIYCRYH
jgi:hypothetical protein